MIDVYKGEICKEGSVSQGAYNLKEGAKSGYQGSFVQ